MILLELICSTCLIIDLVTGIYGESILGFAYSPTDPVAFLSSNNLGQLYIESPAQSQILADGLAELSAFDYSFDEKLVFYVGVHQLQNTEAIYVIKAVNLTNLQIYNVFQLEHGVINALSIDWHNMMLYWADFKEEYIAVGEINLGLLSIIKHKILISSNLSNLKSICVDPIARFAGLLCSYLL